MVEAGKGRRRATPHGNWGMTQRPPPHSNDEMASDSLQIALHLYAHVDMHDDIHLKTLGRRRLTGGRRGPEGTEQRRDEPRAGWRRRPLSPLALPPLLSKPSHASHSTFFPSSSFLRPRPPFRTIVVTSTLTSPSPLWETPARSALLFPHPSFHQ